MTIATLLIVLLSTHSGTGHLTLEGPMDAVVAISLDGLGRYDIVEAPLLGLAAGIPVRGSLQNVPGGHVLIRRHNGHVAGRVLRPGQPTITFKGMPRAPLQWRLEDRFDQRPCLGVAADGLGTPADSGDAPPPPPQRDGAGDTGAIIDVLAVYTADALEDAGSVDAMETDILSWFDASNSALDDSGINTQVRVVGMDNVDDAETGDLLLQLRQTSDGMFDEVHALRNSLGADVVILFVDSTDEDNDGLANYCGKAYLITTSGGRPSFAFGVVMDSCAESGYTLVHELGHLQGCSHDAENAVGFPGIEDHAYGWVFWGAGDTCDDNRYCTIMAYQGLDEIDCPEACAPGACCLTESTCIDGETDQSCTSLGGTWHGAGSECDSDTCLGDEADCTVSIWTQRIGLFSTPDLDYEGTPVGDAADADNVSVWNDRCSVTAGYRTSVIPLNCPGDLDTSGEVDMVDLLDLLTSWGAVWGSDDADINDDLEVGVVDLLVLLNGYGRCA